jgi:hypothetical protein
VKDWRPHRIATVFGEVRLKLPRFLCAGCDCSEAGVGWPSHRRSTPELDQLRARLSALTANFLVNRRMNKSQQMRWSRSGADLLLQVRCAVYNGSLGSGLGHRFDRLGSTDLTFAKAA